MVIDSSRSRGWNAGEEIRPLDIRLCNRHVRASLISAIEDFSNTGRSRQTAFRFIKIPRTSRSAPRRSFKTPENLSNINVRFLPNQISFTVKSYFNDSIPSFKVSRADLRRVFLGHCKSLTSRIISATQLTPCLLHLRKRIVARI